MPDDTCPRCGAPLEREALVAGAMVAYGGLRCSSLVCRARDWLRGLVR